ncbi:MAG: thioredoxin domain-containing protein [Thermoanaerobaculia bacterium]|nr:thioredoxin domain-containing protein [Thermoanaerobaculia bacterium]
MVPRLAPASSSRLLAAAFILAAVGLVSPSCAAGAESSAGASAKASSDVPAVVAEVAGKPVTRGELEEALAPQLAALERQRQQLLVDGLDGLVEQKILEAEADARGISVEDLFRAEIEAKTGEVSDAQAEEFYAANQARINRPLEQMLPQIKNYLANQRRGELRVELLAGLRAKHAARILLEPVRADVDDPTAPSKGPAAAPVTLVEFSDFQCPYCTRVNPTITQAIETYGDKLRVVFRQFPLNIHPQAQKAAEGSLCANDQGKFWELHDAMFADQRNLSVDQIKAKAAAVGIEAGAFASCLDSGKYAPKVAADMAAGSAAGVSGTPAMFVNGRFLSGAVPFDQLAKLIDDELARKGIQPANS